MIAKPFGRNGGWKIDRLKATLPRIDACVTGLKKVGQEHKGPCPKCGGTDRFWITQDNKFGCRGCHEKYGDVIEFHQWMYGGTIQDLARQYLNGSGPEKLPKARVIPPNLAATYVYTDKAGNYLYQVERYEETGREKQFRQYVEQGGEKITPTKAGVKYVPYNLPGIHDKCEVVIVEGEKDVDRLTAEGIPATTTPGGAQNFKAHYAEWFKGKHLIIIPDQDGAGTTYKKDILKHCLCVAASIKVIDLPKGKDVSEFLDMGGTVGQIRQMVIHAPLEMPDNADDDTTTNQWDVPVDMRMVIYERPDTISWLMSERIPMARGIIITGLGGSSKTRVLYILAIGCVVGFLPWAWNVEMTGKAVLVLTEDTAQDVHRTVHYMALDLTDDQKQALAHNLVIYPLAGKDTRLMVKTSNGTVEKSPLFHSLQEKITSLGDVVFVGLDPALSVSEGDELDQGHQRALGKMADDLAVQTGATVALVAHATKGSLSRLELTSHNSRGGGAITDAVRAEYSMRNMTIEEANQAGITDVEERKRHVQLVCTKGNAIPPTAFVPVWLRRDDFGNLAEVDIQMDGKGTLTDRDMDVLKVHSKIGVFSTPSLADWRVECVKEGLITGANPNAQKQAMKRVVDKLLKAGLIEKGVGRGIYTQTGETTEPPF
jgi:hypothetical protein